MDRIESVRLKVGMEIHVELKTQRKMFSRSPSPAHCDHHDAAPNTLIDPVVLGLPGALPVMNRRAIELSMLVGAALGCSIARFTRWDRKSYFYPDLPKNYQISQYALPLCFDGAVDLPDPSQPDSGATRRIGIIRAHLEEDAGKLLHEWPGGKPIDHSIVDFNRAGTPLLEIVTAPDLVSADEAVAFARLLRDICRFLRATQGILERGHMRFEPNINTILRLADGRQVQTPIVEIKNLNSFRALRGAVEYEQAHQPERFLDDGRMLGSGTKSTRGWDDVRGVTVLQREKEEADDYRYFPDPDIPPLRIDARWRDAVLSALPELPAPRARRYRTDYALGDKEAHALVEDRDVCEFFESVLGEVSGQPGLDPEPGGKIAAHLILQTGFRRANEQGVAVNELGITPAQLAGMVQLRAARRIGSSAVDRLFDHLCHSDEDAQAAAEALSLIQVSDTGQIDAWCDEVLSDSALARAVADVRKGKTAAIGRLIGAVMKRSSGQADAAQVRRTLLAKLEPEQ